MLLGVDADVYFTGEMSHVSLSSDLVFVRLTVLLYSTKYWRLWPEVGTSCYVGTPTQSADTSQHWRKS